MTRAGIQACPESKTRSGASSNAYVGVPPRTRTHGDAGTQNRTRREKNGTNTRRRAIDPSIHACVLNPLSTARKAFPESPLQGEGRAGEGNGLRYSCDRNLCDNLCCSGDCSVQFSALRTSNLPIHLSSTPHNIHCSSLTPFASPFSARHETLTPCGG